VACIGNTQTWLCSSNGALLALQELTLGRQEARRPRCAAHLGIALLLRSRQVHTRWGLLRACKGSKAAAWLLQAAVEQPQPPRSTHKVSGLLFIDLNKVRAWHMRLRLGQMETWGSQLADHNLPRAAG
jgi:hypothetical protein